MFARLKACVVADHLLYTSHARKEMRAEEFGSIGEQVGGFSKEAIMKCVICSSPDIELKNANEQIWVGDDVALIPLKVLVCANCGERYYDRRAMHQLEEAEQALKERRLQVETAGRVLRVTTTE